MARKSPHEATPAEAGFTPLLAGSYVTGGEVNGRVQILREDKPAVYLPLEKLMAYENAGEIVVLP